VTASHNPAKYNGLKITKGDNTSIGQGNGMEELRDLSCSDEPIPQSNARGTVSDDDGLLERYIETIWSRSKLAGDFSDWRIAIDAGNGMEGFVLPKLPHQPIQHPAHFRCNSNCHYCPRPMHKFLSLF